MSRAVFLGVLFLFLLSCAPMVDLRMSSPTRLEIVRPDAQEVFFACSLDGFSLHPAVAAGRGIWTYSVSAKEEFQYFFLVDGEADIPPCLLKETDDFGSNNCIARPDR